jgi:hypothetical protein
MALGDLVDDFYFPRRKPVIVVRVWPGFLWKIFLQGFQQNRNTFVRQTVPAGAYSANALRPDVRRRRFRHYCQSAAEKCLYNIAALKRWNRHHRPEHRLISHSALESTKECDIDDYDVGFELLHENLSALGIARFPDNRQVSFGLQKRSQRVAKGGFRICDYNSNGSFPRHPVPLN